MKKNFLINRSILFMLITTLTANLYQVSAMNGYKAEKTNKMDQTKRAQQLSKPLPPPPIPPRDQIRQPEAKTDPGKASTQKTTPDLIKPEPLKLPQGWTPIKMQPLEGKPLDKSEPSKPFEFKQQAGPSLEPQVEKPLDQKQPEPEKEMIKTEDTIKDEPIKTPIKTPPPAETTQSTKLTTIEDIDNNIKTLKDENDKFLKLQVLTQTADEKIKLYKALEASINKSPEETLNFLKLQEEYLTKSINDAEQKKQSGQTGAAVEQLEASKGKLSEIKELQNKVLNLKNSENSDFAKNQLLADVTQKRELSEKEANDIKEQFKQYDIQKIININKQLESLQQERKIEAARIETSIIRKEYDNGGNALAKKIRDIENSQTQYGRSNEALKAFEIQRNELLKSQLDKFVSLNKALDKELSTLTEKTDVNAERRTALQNEKRAIVQHFEKYGQPLKPVLKQQMITKKSGLRLENKKLTTLQKQFNRESSKQEKLVKKNLNQIEKFGRQQNDLTKKIEAARVQILEMKGKGKSTEKIEKKLNDLENQRRSLTQKINNLEDLSKKSKDDVDKIAASLTKQADVVESVRQEISYLDDLTKIK